MVERLGKGDDEPLRRPRRRNAESPRVRVERGHVLLTHGEFLAERLPSKA